MTQITSLSESDVAVMMAIENSCHSHPMSQKNMLSCFGTRYFNYGLYQADSLIGFYLAEMAGPDFTLMDICIAPEYQGQGYAQQLLQHLIDQATMRNAESLFLEVRASNTAAIKLYEKCGFNEMGIRKNYYPAAQGREDAKLMGLMLLPFN